MKVLGQPLEERNEVYIRLLERAGHDTSYDWFERVYMSELSNRKDHAQFFTPPAIGELLSKMADNGKGAIHEPAAGTGGLVIKLWENRRKRYLPWEFLPTEEMKRDAINSALKRIFKGDFVISRKERER